MQQDFLLVQLVQDVLGLLDYETNWDGGADLQAEWFFSPPTSHCTQSIFAPPRYLSIRLRPHGSPSPHGGVRAAR